MKLPFVIALAALAVASSPLAQTQTPNAPVTDHSSSAFGFDESAPYVPYMPSGKYLAEQHASYDRARRSCAADQQRLCHGRRQAGMSCVSYHKLEISRTCRVDMEKAAQGRL